MSNRVLILGAGFGGLELATLLADSPAEVEVTLIDRSETFTPGAAAIDLLLGRVDLPAVSTPYTLLRKPGVQVLNEEIVAIDPGSRTVTTDAGIHEADVLVIALGADYDLAATPGLAEHGHNLYSPAVAAGLAATISGFSAGRIVIGICAPQVKCPPAPSAIALLLADSLSSRGVGEQCEVTLVTPAPAPVPPSPEASEALLGEFERAGVRFLPDRQVAAIEPGSIRADGGPEVPFDLLLGVPQHRVPAVVRQSGLAADGYVPVDPGTLETRFDGIYAIGDVAGTEAPKAGVFAEDAARTVARNVLAALGEGGGAPPHAGRGSCYVELGQGRVGRIDVNTYPEKNDHFNRPTADLAAEKGEFGPDRLARWFGS